MTARTETDPCPNVIDHTPCPSGYIQWHEWAAKISKTHRNLKCAGCGLYKIWEPNQPTTQDKQP